MTLTSPPDEREDLERVQVGGPVRLLLTLGAAVAFVAVWNLRSVVAMGYELQVFPFAAVVLLVGLTWIYGGRGWRGARALPGRDHRAHLRALPHPAEDPAVNALAEGLSALLTFQVVWCLLLGLVLGLLVGAFPGVTATMAVALASGFTLTFDPIPGLAVLLTIYVAANFGDRIPSILINTPGTPASIATTLDGYPMAKKGQAGLALTASAIVSALAIVVSLVVFAVAAIPIATLARDYFRSPELFALVVFGLTVMIGISSKSVLKGILAGLFGLALGTIGVYAATGDQRLTFGNINLAQDGFSFIAVIIGLFGMAELFDQMLTAHARKLKPISALGRWWPTRKRGPAVGQAVRDLQRRRGLRRPGAGGRR